MYLGKQRSKKREKAPGQASVGPGLVLHHSSPGSRFQAAACCSSSAEVQSGGEVGALCAQAQSRARGSGFRQPRSSVPTPPSHPQPSALVMVPFLSALCPTAQTTGTGCPCLPLRLRPLCTQSRSRLALSASSHALGAAQGSGARG